MSKPLEGQIALVTGASRGIGAATALALATEGAHVILTARKGEDLEVVEQAIYEGGGTATIAPADLTDAEAIGRLAQAVAGRWSKLDILVLNAAMLGTLGPVQHIDTAELAKLLTLNISAQQSMISAFDPLLRRSDDARIFGLTSSVGAKPRAYWGAYGATKAALETLLLSYGEENRHTGRLKLAIIDPGATRTAMRAKAYPGEDPLTLKEPKVVGEFIKALAINGFETCTKHVVNHIT